MKIFGNSLFFISLLAFLSPQSSYASRGQLNCKAIFSRAVEKPLIVSSDVEKTLRKNPDLNVELLVRTFRQQKNTQLFSDLVIAFKQLNDTNQWRVFLREDILPQAISDKNTTIVAALNNALSKNKLNKDYQTALKEELALMVSQAGSPKQQRTLARAFDAIFSNFSKRHNTESELTRLLTQDNKSTFAPKQTEIEAALKEQLDSYADPRQPPLRSSQIRLIISALPEAQHFSYFSKILENHKESVEHLTMIIGKLPVSQGAIRAVNDFLSGTGSFLILRKQATSFSNQDIMVMFKDPVRFRKFFPNATAPDFKNPELGYQFKAAAMLSGNSKKRKFFPLAWYQKAIDQVFEIKRALYTSVLGFRASESMERMRWFVEQNFDRMVEPIENIKGLIVQGHYERNGNGLIRKNEYRGRAEFETEVPELLRLINENLESRNLSKTSTLIQRLFVNNWGYFSGDLKLLDNIRMHAIDVAQLDRSFGPLRVEIHNLPSQDVINRSKLFLANLERGTEAHKELDNLIAEMELFVGAGGSINFQKVLRDLPGLKIEKKPLFEAAKGLGKFKTETQLEKLAELRQLWIDAKLNSNTENNRIDLYRGDQALSSQAMLLTSKLINAIESRQQIPTTADLVRISNLIWTHMKLDGMLSSKQIKHYNSQFTKILKDQRTVEDKKISFIIDLIQNSVDQVYFSLENQFGSYDNKIFQMVRSKETVSPVRMIDETMRSNNVFMMGKLIDTISEMITKSKNLTHSIGGNTVNFSVEVLNPGTAQGVLRIDKNPMELLPEEIAVFSEMPMETSALGGIITLGVGARLSHLQLLAKSLEIPNVKISSQFLELLREYDGRKISIDATKEGLLTIQEIDANKPDQQRASTREIVVPVPDHSIKNAITFKEAAKIDDVVFAGPKGINLAKMFSDPGINYRVPDGFILPFGFFNRYIETIGIGHLLKQMQKIELENTHTLTMIATKIRNKISENPVPKEMMDEVIDQLKKLQKRTGSKDGYFFRSDTNIEDLPNFNGAGLNDSVPNVRIDPKSVDQAIRQVWISPFLEKSLSWRGLALNSKTASVAEPSIVVLPTVKARSSGVIISRGTEDWRPGKGSISSNWGIGSVVEAGRPVEEVNLGGQEHIIHSFTVSDVKPVARGNSGIEFVPAQPGTPVLTQKQITELKRMANNVEQRLGKEPHGWDIEWAIDSRGDVVILQSRPNM